MNQHPHPPPHTFPHHSQIDPALRQSSLSSPPKQQYQDAGRTAYSPLQPSPNNSYQGIQTPNYFSSTAQTHDSPEDDQSPSGNPSDPNDLKRPRACEACRQLKVKCEPDDNSPTGSCKRCAKANRQCVVTAPSRKRQKKTDSRVAELEKKIDALSATLAARGGDPDINLDPAIAPAPRPPHRTSIHGEQWNQNAHYQPMGAQSPYAPAPVAGTKRKAASEHEFFGGELPKANSQGFKSPQPPVPHFPAMFTSEHKAKQEADDGYQNFDCIDSGLIDAKTAWRCFERYDAEMCNNLPIVVFPPNTRPEEVRRTKPILFLAVVAVASGTIRPDLQSKLISQATRILAEKIVYRGEKSLELVQTIQVMTVFYQPPEKYEELNFNQLIHIAAVMALDIGMGKRSKPGSVAKWRGPIDNKKPLPDPNIAETRRCWLGCYYMCSK